MSQMTMKPMHRGVDAVLYINGEILGGQQNAILNRIMTPIDITNKINGEWGNSLSGVKQWSLNCSGMLVKNSHTFDLLEQAFNNGDKITVKLSDELTTYEGEALIVNFPVTARYNENFIYNITLRGIGELR